MLVGVMCDIRSAEIRLHATGLVARAKYRLDVKCS